MNRLIIGAVTALLTPDEPKVTPDDRQELAKTLIYTNGAFTPSVSVIDGGYCLAGAVMSLSGVKFKNSDWPTIYGYWTNRTKITLIDCAGNSTANCRVVLKAWTQNKYFSSVITADIEIWQV